MKSLRGQPEPGPSPTWDQIAWKCQVPLERWAAGVGGCRCDQYTDKLSEDGFSQMFTFNSFFSCKWHSGQTMEKALPFE